MPFRAKAKENGTVMSEEARERRTKLAISSSASAVNFVLGVMKVLAGVWTNSLSILTDGVNNFGDVLSNAGAAVGFAVEKKAPTKRFPGGFGRVEYVVSFVMAIIIMAVGGGFMYSALDRVFYHPVVTFAWTQFGIVAATIVVKIGLAVMFRLSWKKFPSDVLKAQTTDSVMDACITTFALLGLFLSRYIQFPVDAFIGIAISVAMIVAGLKLAVSAFMRLAGGADFRRANGIKKLALAQKGVTDARVRVYDFGTKCAEAAVELFFENDLPREDVSEAERRIALTAEKAGIRVMFVHTVQRDETTIAADERHKEGQ